MSIDLRDVCEHTTLAPELPVAPPSVYCELCQAIQRATRHTASCADEIVVACAGGIRLIKALIKPGREEEARRITREFEVQSRTEGIGPTRVFVFRNQSDPDEHHTPAVLESEDEAYNVEKNPAQDELIRRYWSVNEDL